MRLTKIAIALLLLAALVQPMARADQPLASAQSAARPPFRYGMVVSDTGNYHFANDIGFGWVKIFVSWADIETSPGVYTFYPIDNAVTQARASNLHVLALVYNTPGWANSSG